MGVPWTGKALPVLPGRTVGFGVPGARVMPRTPVISTASSTDDREALHGDPAVCQARCRMLPERRP